MDAEPPERFHAARNITCKAVTQRPADYAARMVKRIVSATSIALLLASCSSARTGESHPSAATSAADAAYHDFADAYLLETFRVNPQFAVTLGVHEYDGQTPDYRPAATKENYARLKQDAARLAEIRKTPLSPEVVRESRVLEAQIDGELQGFEVSRYLTHNPMTYAAAFDVTTYAQRDFKPLQQRLESVVAILDTVPATMQVARTNLEATLPKPYVEAAIEQADGAADFMTGDLPQAFADVTDSKMQKRFKQSREAAAAALRAYSQWLKTDHAPQADDGFAIGRENFVRMLRKDELLEESPEQLLALGMATLRKEQARFESLAREIDPSRPPAEVFKEIQHDHPAESSLIADTRKHLEDIRQFVTGHDLIGIPSEQRVEVKETPKFARAGSFASMDSPGPFEAAKQAFYYVTPTEADWPAQRKEEWLQSFNYYTTDIVSIHEAYPGHYVQFLKLKASDASRVAKCFGSYAYTEGWAHYCEQMLVEQGFPDNADDLTRRKYALAQSSEALLRLCRLCVAIQMHCQHMSLEQATQFFKENCHYEQAPAYAEARRGTFDPGYGFYTLGKLQLLKLRDDCRAQEGKAFSLRKFHDALTSHGQPPIRLLREIMLKDRASWAKALPDVAAGL